MELENEIENKNDIEIKQNNFLNNTISKIINNTLDIGLRAILPDLIENQIINIKNALLESGIKGGIDEAIKSVINFGKSTQGIFTGKFENIEQINYAISKGGIIDTVSNLIDFAADKAYNSNLINKTVNTIIKQGKDILIDNITSNIEKELDRQTNYIENLETNIQKWKKSYNEKNFAEMEEEYNSIKQQMEMLIPIENLIKEVREIETLHNLIKNNNQNFNISAQEMELIKKLS